VGFLGVFFWVFLGGFFNANPASSLLPGSRPSITGNQLNNKPPEEPSATSSDSQLPAPTPPPLTTEVYTSYSQLFNNPRGGQVLRYNPPTFTAEMKSYMSLTAINNTSTGPFHRTLTF
jgi:hypothetical protein